MPYQVLVNEWVTSLGDTPLGTVEDYRDAFLDWLTANQQWFDKGRAEGEWISLINRRYDVIRNGVLESVADDDGRIGAEAATVSELKQWVSGLSTFTEFPNSDDEWLQRANQTLSEGVTRAMEYWFDDIPRSPEIDDLIRAYSHEFFRRSGYWDNTATLAFVGFGESQLLPAYALCDVAGILEGRVRCNLGEARANSTEQDPLFSIRPLGQTSAIELFLKGYEYKTIELAADAAIQHLREVRAGVEKAVGEEAASTDEFDRVFADAEASMSSAVSGPVVDASEERYVAPLRNAIASLPVATLAEVARSLVELQALRQTTTAEQSTVGGPIDVAMISRSGGFEWVRHKTVSGRR
jgi:hypothetical protein